MLGIFNVYEDIKLPLANLLCLAFDERQATVAIDPTPKNWTA